MFISSELLIEIQSFLTLDLIEENLSQSCRVKLNNLVCKIDQCKLSASRSSTVYEDYDIYEEPCKSESVDLSFELPTRLEKSANEISVTLSGSLYYRYNLQCWEHYPFSCLLNGRLVCCKSSAYSYNNSNSHVANENFNNCTTAGKSMELSIFLMGYTAVMTGKDCGMNFVFKLTHPTEETKVFSTESEEESLVWIEQINQYSIGSTPSDVKWFNNHSDMPQDISDEFDAITHFSSGSDCSSIDDGNKIAENIHLRRQPSEVLNQINNSTVTSPKFIISDLKFNRSRSSYCFKNPIISNQPLSCSTSTCSTTSAGSNSIISSMRRKVEYFGNKYRNRKSFAGFSSRSFNVNGGPNSKSKTLPQFSPEEINKRATMHSLQFLPSSKDTIFSGVAKLRIQGNRAGWIERWCQLKPKLLECFYLQTPNNNMTKPALDFALCLENLTLGVSNDKKHRSALRLSCDSVKQDLLFEVLDKVLMGDWIKAFIEALGISNPKSAKNCDTIDLMKKDENKEFEDDIMQRSLATIQSIGSESIYDEVCPPDIREPDQTVEKNCTVNTNSQQYQRRWSSPVIEISNLRSSSQSLQPPSAPYAGRRSLRDHPLPSLPASSPDSETNSDTIGSTPTGTNVTDIESMFECSTFTKHIGQSRTSTLKSVSKQNSYQLSENSLDRNTIYSGDDSNLPKIEDESEMCPSEFNDNKTLWRVQGCSLADLIARFEPESESQEHSSATMSSKTDSSCTPTFQNSSEDNINSISNSFISIQSFDQTANSCPRKVCRSNSADTDIGIIRQNVPANRRERPHSLIMKKTSLELVFEEIASIKEDIRSLRKQKKNLQRSLSHKSENDKPSIEHLLTNVSSQITSKEFRLKELSTHSRKRFTVEVALNQTKDNGQLSFD